MFIALGLLSPAALAGLAMYVIGHAAIKGALFVCAGILLHRFHSVDEFDLRGCGREIMPLALLMLLGVWGLAGLPPFATFYGQSFIDHSAEENHLAWLSAITLFAEALTAGAVLRVTCRVFLGWGNGREATLPVAAYPNGTGRTDDASPHVPPTMWLGAVALLIVGMLAATFPSSRARVQHQSDLFRDGTAQQSIVLDGQQPPAIGTSPVPPVELTWRQLASLAATVLLAAAALTPAWLGRGVNLRIGHILHRFMHVIRLPQSGRVGD